MEELKNEINKLKSSDIRAKRYEGAINRKNNIIKNLKIVDYELLEEYYVFPRKMNEPVSKIEDEIKKDDIIRDLYKMPSESLKMETTRNESRR